MKRNAMVFVGLTISTWSVFASGVVQNVTARQIQPWNSLVEIQYELTEDMRERGCLTVVVCEDQVRGINYAATMFVNEPTYEKGVHKLIWDSTKEGVSFVSKQVVFSVSIVPSVYCVIDLSRGKDATEYPVSFLAAEPNSEWTDEYKTTKIVLRRIEAGSFMMGRSSVSDNQPHQVTLTKPFYLGVFEVTQKQYELVTGINPSYFSENAKRPVECVSYNMIRGNSDGANWPAANSVDATSFLGKLRSRTGLDFDLPTEAQWEYACRAGTTTLYSYGDVADGKYMWYSFNSPYSTHDVGTRLPNAYGLYDMHGNVAEWCLDWRGSVSVGTATDPKGSDSGSYRVLRGGIWCSGADYCTSCARMSGDPSSAVNFDEGFRLSWTLRK